ncbi:GNAT family N-acetyltransferase [Cognatishimia sp.]|uniref:GNAT family N-acetyltransferase n=1 Tax=Cognatishimia sp. TaxID=2211648 RepID=UPI003BADB8D3
MAELLNEIINVGGTTAYTNEVTSSYIQQKINSGTRSAWHLAESSQGEVLGFQWIEQSGALPVKAAEIATFAQVGKTGLGIGSKLFEATKKVAVALDYTWIRANIRSDNSGGLIYYQSRGFEDYGVEKNVTLADGTIVDKVLKRYDL